jgi:hypothetical protein
MSAFNDITKQIKFYPAGKLTVRIGCGKAIAFPEAFLQNHQAASRIDAYTQLSLEGAKLLFYRCGTSTIKE